MDSWSQISKVKEHNVWYITKCRPRITKFKICLFLVFDSKIKRKRYDVIFTLFIWVMDFVDTKSNEIFEILKKLQVGSVCFLCKNAFKIWSFSTWFWTGLHRKSGTWHHRVKWSSLSISTNKIAQKTWVTLHASDFYFSVTFCELTLTFSFSGKTLYSLSTFLDYRYRYAGVTSYIAECLTVASWLISIDSTSYLWT